MTQRKLFDYKNSTPYAIADHFHSCSRQAVDNVRKFWVKDDFMTSKLNAAYYMYKNAQLMESLDTEYKDFLDLC